MDWLISDILLIAGMFAGVILLVLYGTGHIFP